jgi:GT2 family glycosyltransferase
MHGMKDAFADPESRPAAPPIVAGAGRLVAVLVTHDRPAHLARSLDALLSSPPRHLAAVLVVDNASGLPTKAVLAGIDDPRLMVRRLDENLGGAGGFEAGLRDAAQTLSPDWLLVLDDDAWPDPGALAAFHALDLTGWDAVAAAVRHPDGALCEMNRPILDPFRSPRLLLRTLAGGGREAFHLTARDYDGTSLRAVDGASFVGLFLSADVVARHGYPDGRLFLYADDALYTQAMTKAGYRLAFAPQVRFTHDSQTYSRSDPRMRPLWKVYYYHRNLTLLYRQATGVFFWPVMLLHVPRWALRLRHHGGERRTFLRLFLTGLRDGLANRVSRTHAEVLRMAGCVSVPATRDGTGATAADPEPSGSARRTEQR